MLIGSIKEELASWPGDISHLAPNVLKTLKLFGTRAVSLSPPFPPSLLALLVLPLSLSLDFQLL